MNELRELEPDFWRAPSAHNTRPWTLTYSDTEAAVGWDPARALPVSDPTGRDLRLSLGAFVECCLIVCADAGLGIAFRPDPGPLRVGFLYRAGRPYETPFTTADVRARGANRGDYHPGRLPDEVAAGLAGMRRLACRDLADLLHAADLRQFGDRQVTRELRAWLRLTRRHRRYLLDGLSDRALALSKAEALALRASLALYPALRRLGLPRVLAGASRELLDYDGDVLVLVGTAGEEVEPGRLLMRHWLTLSGLGYTTHPLSQLIDCERTRASLAGLLGVADPRTLLHVARVGRPKPG
ncbi:hypothetical protein [Nonomuraea jiangxiensis]|uniref:Nitroreductase family protein n=1 Tax=Nonomuraea jiangxiensis TaxID=633440 RepID=A0A1G9DCU4_9ACTN|nr:hypothetical protein [Nonomuraea jiangxiensis]SDK61665.1 hypothetical protein SAMN05421869_11786 [Nonomuraea jiangxiensis]